ncbi:MAG: HTTM domain-containing protein [Deltaproteobacteria bacterium]|nr:HTTM domain-containing protein [Deltaproteobacteria bacterium]
MATVFSDVVDMVWVGKDFGGLNRVRRVPFWIELLGGPTKDVVHGMLALCLFSLFCVGTGFRARIAALVAGQSYMSLYRLNPFAHGSYDIVITNALWILVLAESSRTLSIDCKLRSGKWQSDDEVSVWPRGLVLLNLALMYGTTGIQKVSIYWTPAGGYSALYYILQQPSWHNFRYVMGGVFLFLHANRYFCVVDLGSHRSSFIVRSVFCSPFPRRKSAVETTS